MKLNLPNESWHLLLNLFDLLLIKFVKLNNNHIEIKNVLCLMGFELG